MQNEPDAARFEADRARVAEYLRGDQAVPLVIEHRDAYCVCDVFLPTRRSRVRTVLRAFVTALARRILWPALQAAIYRRLGARIGRNVFISPGVVFDPLFPQLIEVEDDCTLGMGCRLFTHEYTATHFRVGRVRIRKGAVIGGYSTVRAGVTVGEKATVGFQSYVNRDVPSGDVVGGVPAKSLKPIPPADASPPPAPAAETGAPPASQG